MIVVASCCLLLPLILLAAAFAALSAAFGNLDFSNHREHLRPIPISAGACPYVEAMHQAASDYQAGYPFGFVELEMDANGRPLTWPAARARIERVADVLEYTIIVGSAHLPARVRRYLATVRHDLDAGREQLRLARDDLDLTSRISRLQSEGQRAFGYASDLIGEQCGVPLGA